MRNFRKSCRLSIFKSISS